MNSADGAMAQREMNGKSLRGHEFDVWEPKECRSCGDRQSLLAYILVAKLLGRDIGRLCSRRG